MTKLSPLMREALKTALAQDGIRRTHKIRKPGEKPPPKPEWPFHARTLNALVEKELLDRTSRKSNAGNLVDEWQITDAGREALDPPRRPRRDTFRSMRAKGDAQTRVLVGGVWQDIAVPEPEEVDPATLSPLHGMEAQARWDRARDNRLKVAQRNALTRKRAA